jgi:cation diffusion facilitator CzcD-associated flavoprotein CzcO
MGCRLKQVLGTDQFRIFERQSGIGGTWWINRYPGAACDMYVLSRSGSRPALCLTYYLSFL